MASSECCENPPDLSSSHGEGKVVENFGGLKAYITGSLDSKAAILLVSDVFGYEAPKLRKLADKTAAAGFYVVVPDFLNGDPYVPDAMPIMTWLGSHGTVNWFSFDPEYHVEKEQLCCYLTRTTKDTHQLIRENLHETPTYGGLGEATGPRYCPSIEYKIVRFQDKESHQIFLEPEGRNVPELYVQDKGFEDAKRVVEALRSKGFSAVGAAGFCWGAKVIAELAKSGEIKAGVMLHPSLVTVDDIKATKTHLAILGAEIDKTSPPELVKQFGEILSSKSEVESFVKIFPGVSHGWTVRYEDNEESVVAKAEEAHADMIGWFVKHLL